MGIRTTDRIVHEIAHGRLLAEGDPEEIWGWGTAAGRLRARRRAELILKGSGAKSRMRLLEIGCGTGFFTSAFAASGADIVAVDLSPDLLRRARSRGLPPERVQFIEKNFEDCAVDGPFDAVIGSSVLHHLELDRSIRKIFELLRPGGRMSFAEPNMLNPQVFAERRFRRLFPHVSPDETAFLRVTLTHRLQQVGFREISIVPFDWLHPSTPSALIPLVSRVGRLLETLWPIREFAGSLWITALKPVVA
jgi:2-polyprenyl-3-methyl-5-hydroxy-6-metoxy-1,4-benzoquinol methylase